MRHRAPLSEVAQGFLDRRPLLRRLRLVVGRSEEQGALDGIISRSQADKQPARSRQILLGKGIDEAMRGFALADGRTVLWQSHPPGRVLDADLHELVRLSAERPHRWAFTTIPLQAADVAFGSLANLLADEIRATTSAPSWRRIVASTFLAQQLGISSDDLPPTLPAEDSDFQVIRTSRGSLALQWAGHVWPFALRPATVKLATHYVAGYEHQSERRNASLVDSRSWPRELHRRAFEAGAHSAGSLAAPSHLLDDLAWRALEDPGINRRELTEAGYTAAETEDLLAGCMVGLAAGSVLPAGPLPISFGGRPTPDMGSAVLKIEPLEELGLLALRPQRQEAAFFMGAHGLPRIAPPRPSRESCGFGQGTGLMSSSMSICFRAQTSIRPTPV